MALSSEVQKLVTAEKWKEAYDLASGEQGAEDNSFLIYIEDSESEKDGYLKGDELRYSIVSDAEEASSLPEKDAKKLARKIKSKTTSSTLVPKSAIIQNVGSQGTEKGEVIELFLKKRFSKVDFNIIKDIVTKWIEELGFSYNTNPFLQFMDEYLKKHQTIDTNTLEIINDLYANNEIETTDLQAKTSEGTNSLIFNKNLYKFTYDDAEFIVQAYKWLSDFSNISSYMTNVDALTKYDITDVKKIDNKKAIEIRNQIIFKNAQSSSNSEINTVADISRETRFLEAGGAKRVSDENTEKVISISGQVKNEPKWKNLISKNVTTAQEAQDLINYLAKEFKLI